MVNPSQQLARTLSTIDLLQFLIADMDRRMDLAQLAESVEDVHRIRLVLATLKAALANERNSEAGWRQQIQDEKEARKAQGDIARA